MGVTSVVTPMIRSCQISRLVIIIILLLNISLLARAQFTQTSFELEIGHTVCSADLNGDYYEDFIVSGSTDENGPVEEFTRVYLNNQNGNFSFTGQNLTGFAYWNTHIALGDYDNDNAIDFIISGSHRIDSWTSETLSLLYRNDGTGHFTSVSNGTFPNDLGGVYQWGDYDNDGDQDLFYTGRDVTNARIYKNNNGYFTEEETNIGSLSDGNVRAGDYDNDGDRDLLMNGQDSISNKYTWIVKNTDGNFSRLNIGFPGSNSTGTDWGDYDNDGDLDFLIAGAVYRNDGNDQFSMVSNPSFAGISSKVMKWGDYDLDGDLDILTTKTVFENDGTGVFEQHDISPFPSETWGSDWIDYDKDGDLDILVTTHYITVLQENTTNNPHNNNLPSDPTNMTSEQVGTSVILRWDPSSDDLSGANIQYNVRFGYHSYPSPDYVVSPMANPYVGDPKVRGLGNAGFINEMVIHDVIPGEYHWGVSAVDNSGFATWYKRGFIVMMPFFSSAFVDSSSVMNRSSVCWGDYNNDGYLDAFSNGRIYTNQGGNDFTISHNLPHPDYVEHAEWVDYDNDGDLDISYCGYNVDFEYISSVEFNVYYNQNNQFYKDTQNQFDGVARGNFCWKDFNSDGLKDIIITGLTYIDEYSSSGLTKFFLNTKATGFIETSFPVPTDEWGYCYAEDLDSDMDYDIVFRSEGRAFINDGSGVFNLADKGIESISGDYVFADYDNDKDIDILASGEDEIGNKSTVIMRNSGSAFTNIYAALPGASTSSVNWMDTDGDHDLDMFVSGFAPSFKLYHVENTGIDQFVTERVNDIPLSSGNVRMGDFDNDGDPDMLFSGRISGDERIGMFRNNYNELGIPPNTPENLRSEMDGFDVIFTWDDPVDNSEIPIGYSFDVKVGTSPGGVDIVAPESNPQTGFIRTIHIGNASLNNSFRIKDLPLGKYYWSVLAINQGYQTSAWAPGQSFSITSVSPAFDFDTVCHGSFTSFTDHSVTSDVISGWKWEFGDGTISTSRNPTHLFQMAGVHNVTLWAYAQAGDSASVTHQVLVLESPEVIYEAPPVCDREGVVFTDQSILGSLSGISYQWDFGDGENSTSQSSVTHLYSDPGTYSTSLTISEINGCSGQSIQEVTVAKYPPATISLEPGYTNIFCSDDSTILIVPNSTTYNYQWKLNNENVFGETTNSMIVKGPAGEYSILVENPVAGCLSADSILITIDDVPGIPVILSENYQVGVCPGETPITLKVETTEANTIYLWKRNGIPIDGATQSIYSGYLAEGDYNVEALKNECGTDSEVLTIDYGDVPDKPEILVKGPVVWYLACSNDSAEVFHWYWNGELIEQASEFLYVAGNQEGKFEVAIAGTSGCLSRSDPVYIPLGTGIEQNPWMNLKIYPNPTPGLFTLEMDNPIMGELLIDIYTDSGKKIINIKFLKETSHFRTEIDLSEQPAAIYLIGLILGEYSTTRALVVE